MMINLKNQRILITGASSGIGKAIAQKVSHLGAQVILFGRDLDRLSILKSTLNNLPNEMYATDLTKFNDVAEIIKSSVLTNGPINGLVHCAGIQKILPFKASTPKVFKEVFEINVFAGFEIARIIVNNNIQSEALTSFVFISSVMGKLGDAGEVIYCASKGALVSGVKALAIELASKNIRCNCILPGIVKTEMSKRLFESIPDNSKEKIIAAHPLGLGTPDDIASITAFLLSSEAKWITGSDFIVDGGYSAH
jgi:NAD(P)-dependent dehydrogenase (short-subunit alcohol dehydrogenase family)